MYNSANMRNKKHTTMMKEFRELEKRLLNLEREHNKLTKRRYFYCKSASTTRPYLSEQIVARVRPQTAPQEYLCPSKACSSNHVPSKEIEKMADFEVKWNDNEQGKTVYCSEEVETDRLLFEAVRKRGIKNTNDLRLVDTKREFSPNRQPLSRTSFRSSSQNSNRNLPVNNRNRSETLSSSHNRNRTVNNRPPSVYSRNSSANGGRSVASEISHLEKRKDKSWVYHPMSIFSEKQSVYTLVVPPVRVAEESKRPLKKRKNEGSRRRHVGWIDDKEHVMRFQGIPREFYVHHDEKTSEFDMEKLKHCRYLRK